MSYLHYKGQRKSSCDCNKSITIFLMSFIFPATTGYLKRMDLLLTWANKRFSSINLIIPASQDVPKEIIDAHLIACDNLFIINKSPSQGWVLSLKKLCYKLFTGRYPSLHSDLLLDKNLKRDFSTITSNNKTDFFLNTRNNFAGLIYYLPTDIKSVFDTQDIYTDMYKKHSLYGKSKLVRNILAGYRETGNFFKSEVEALNRYNRVIAISEIDYQKYRCIPQLKDKVCKIESIGIKPNPVASACLTDKKYDVLIVASSFLATQVGIEWFIYKVVPNFHRKIRLCVVGSIGNYLSTLNYDYPLLNVDIKGIVESLDYYYKASELVAICIFEGTGTSVKGLEALAYGATIISTSSGVRFGGVESEKQCVISDDPEKFAAAIESLLEDEERRHALGVNALQYANTFYSIESTYSQLDHVFDF